MLVALLRGKPVAQLLHHGLRSANVTGHLYEMREFALGHDFPIEGIQVPDG